MAIAVGSREDPIELARRIAELGPRQVIIKLGEACAVSLIDSNDDQRDVIKVPVTDPHQRLTGRYTQASLPAMFPAIGRAWGASL